MVRGGLLFRAFTTILYPFIRFFVGARRVFPNPCDLPVEAQTIGPAKVVGQPDHKLAAMPPGVNHVRTINQHTVIPLFDKQAQPSIH
jgi:hypothetical protein